VFRVDVVGEITQSFTQNPPALSHPPHSHTHTHTQAGRQEQALSLIRHATSVLGVPPTKFWYRILLAPFFRSSSPLSASVDARGNNNKGGKGASGGGWRGPDYQVWMCEWVDGWILVHRFLIPGRSNHTHTHTHTQTIQGIRELLFSSSSSSPSPSAAAAAATTTTTGTDKAASARAVVVDEPAVVFLLEEVGSLGV
jgi:hypothetical protein